MTTPPVLLIAGHGTRDTTGADGRRGPAARRPGRHRSRPLAAVGSTALSSRVAESSAPREPGPDGARHGRPGVRLRNPDLPVTRGGRREEPGFRGDGGGPGGLGGHGLRGEHSDHGSHVHAH
ncbi:hypothetical protein ACIQ9E_28750 [Streptomyces sp. NPDC094448]|uniref:hypothetical protein n=1 Tax=Streptomyces sp. NPDC094448 TaxID=3366063 RepID=UPI003816F6B8